MKIHLSVTVLLKFLIKLGNKLIKRAGNNELVTIYIEGYMN